MGGSSQHTTIYFLIWRKFITLRDGYLWGVNRGRGFMGALSSVEIENRVPELSPLAALGLF